ncbi:MAG: hypothetical protein WCQ90_11080 [Deltaproteobacteria bacterium]
MRHIQLIGILFFITSFMSGCAHCPPVDPQHKLFMQFDDPIISLAKAVDVVVDKLPSDAKDETIFQEAVKRSNNPNLLKPFEGYILRARIQGAVGIILLCTPDGKEGIIEDVSCTTRPDSFRPTGSPCDYFLDAGRVCSSR